MTAPYLTFSDNNPQMGAHYLFVIIIHNTVNRDTETNNIGIIIQQSYGKIIQKKVGEEMKRLNEKLR
jgi:hypothetical protein